MKAMYDADEGEVKKKEVENILEQIKNSLGTGAIRNSIQNI